jgi:triacylglycerol esterase/lipase EstA (alpha/beta hydrolase family)
MIWMIVGVVVGGASVFQALTYTLWLYEGRVHRGGARRPRVRPVPASMLLWGGELMATLLVQLSWPFGLRDSRRVEPSRSGARPVLLVPGWSLNRASLAVLTARLRRDGRDAYAVNYSTTARDFDRKAREVADALVEIAERSGSDRVDVVAHSQGGVVLRLAAARDGVGRRVGNVVTLGSPHRGATLAAAFPELGVTELMPGSRMLERLVEEEPFPESVHFASIYSGFDAIVFPTALSEHPRAMNIAIDDVGHHGLLYSDRVYGLVKENLDVEPRGS